MSQFILCKIILAPALLINMVPLGPTVTFSSSETQWRAGRATLTGPLTESTGSWGDDSSTFQFSLISALPHSGLSKLLHWFQEDSRIVNLIAHPSMFIKEEVGERP